MICTGTNNFILVETIESLIIQGSGSIAFGTASIIATEGLIVAPIDENLSDAEKLAAAEIQLENNRANCEGMDLVATSLTSIYESSSLTLVCGEEDDDDCGQITEESKTLIVSVTSLLQLSSQNIEDTSIATLATEILTFIETNQIEVLSYEQKNILISLTESIRFTVLVYISQISVIESQKFEIAGSIVFPGASISIDDIDEADITLQISVLEIQLFNLFQISDANDKVLECIVSLEDLPATTAPETNSEFISLVQNIPAMCSSPEPPVKEIQETAANITKLCGSFTSQPTPGELNILVFIKQSLITFKQTFITQITIFSQKLSVLTKSEVTAASLGVEVISSSGEIEVATAVDISGGFEEGSIEFLVYRIEILQSSLNAIVSVLERISEVLSLSSGDFSSTSSSFALSISSFSATLSSGAFTLDVMTLAQNVLQIEVTALPPASIVILLESAQSSLQSIQLTILSQITIIKELIFQQAISLSTISFTIQSFDLNGNIIFTDVPISSADENSNTEEFENYIEVLQEHQSSFLKIEEIIQAALTLDFSSIATAVNEVSASFFINKLTNLILIVSQDITDPSILTEISEILELKITTEYLQAVEYRIQFILFIFQSYIIEITGQIQLVQEIQIAIGESSTTRPITEKEEVLILSLQTLLADLNALELTIVSINAALESTSTSGNIRKHH